MSYILDALKKSQPESQYAAINLSPQRRGLPIFWAWVLGFALLLNMFALVWFVFLQEPNTQTSARSPTMDNPSQPTPQNFATNPRSQAEPVTESPPRSIAQPQTQNSTSRILPPAQEPVREPTRTPTQAPNTQPRPQTAELYALAELAPGEQTLFNDLAFTSHIYTEDSHLCAVVINGQRLRNGDSIKDLKIERITPLGVVFEQAFNDGSRTRLVEVNPFE